MQKTIKQAASIKGIGLHTGRPCQARFLPAKENEGIKFIRTDLPGHPSFPAHFDHVVDVVRGTTLGNGDHRVYTIEHLLSCFCGLDLDNLTVELDDNEPPVADGSTKAFVDAILKAGIQTLNAPKNFYTVEEPFEYVSNKTLLKIEPHSSLEIECEIDYDHPLIKNQKFTYTADSNYCSDIAPARTYCFDYEIEGLRKKGLAKGGSLENAIVIGPHGIYNPSQLRFENEFVRHKILDLLGDLMLIGAPLKGRIAAKRSGHGHNINFLKQMLQRSPLLKPISAS